MIHGIDLGEMRDRARLIVQRTLVEKAEEDGVPATLRAMYVLKAQQAEVVLNGGESVNRFIEREAEDRGITPMEMATIISFMSGQSIELELYRTKLNVAIDKAEDEATIYEVLAQAGMQYTEADHPN